MGKNPVTENPKTPFPVEISKPSSPAPVGSQKLIQPLNRMLVGFAYKNTYYPKSFHGFTHYGADY